MTTVTGSISHELFTGGPKRIRGGHFKRAGTTGPGVIMQTMSNLGALYDLGDSRETVRGGVDFDGSTQSMARTSGAIPGVSGGVPSYPLTVVAYLKTDATSASYALSFGLGVDGSDDEISMGIDGSGCASMYVEVGSTGTSTATGVAFTSGRWHVAIYTLGSDSARSVYSDVDTTGASTTTTRAVSGLSRVTVGRRGGASGYWNGEIGPIWILSGDLSGAGNANLRAAIFAGADPVRASAGVATLIAHYPMQDASGASQSGLYDLTPANSPTATSKLLVARDQSGNGRHVRATTSAPTYSTSQGNGQGGGAFASASSQFLTFDGSVPTAAPFQVFAVARSTTTAARGNVWWLGDKDSSNDSWSLEFDGTNTLGTGDDRVVFTAFDAIVNSISGTTYTADTDYVTWALESSSTSRAVQVNGANQATGSTDLSPDNADRFSLGRYAASSPSVYLDGQIHYVILQTTSSTSGKRAIEQFLGKAYNITLA